MVAISKTTVRKLKRRDRFARWFVTLGGIVVIASVIAILFLIVSVTAPLFFPARTERLAQVQLPTAEPHQRLTGLGLEMSVDSRVLVAHLFGCDGTLVLLDLHKGEVLGRQSLRDAKQSADVALRSVDPMGGPLYGLLWSDGAVSVVDVTTKATASEKQPLQPQVKTVDRIEADKGLPPIQAIVRRGGDNGVSVALLLPDNRISVIRQASEENLLGEVTKTTHRTVLDKDLPGKVTAIAMDTPGRTVFAGTDNGCLVTWKLSDRGKIIGQETIPAFRDRCAITSLALALGDATLCVGDAHGQVTTWLLMRSQSSPDTKLRLVRRLWAHDGPVRQILPSGRTKSLVSLGEDAVANLGHLTSGRRLATLSNDPPLRQIALSARGDNLLGLDSAGTLTAWAVRCPHPEVSWSTLFGKVQYEGYDRPEYVWQTTGGEDYEPKFSLVPLLFGTLKGTLYAMLFAVPIALAGAIYVSHFTTPGFKRIIKPGVEMMAALPSVVIGFLAALWLAPLVERYVVAVFAGFVTVPLVMVGFLLVWQRFRRHDWAKRVEHGHEFLVTLPILVLGVLAAIWLVGPLENWLFGGNFKLWLNQTLNARYDQRNNIVIAFGLGFAVIPIIFSLAEDALSNVPHSLTASSLALGASRWQTAWRVVLPSASPGIFAGVMIGFGRAVGETMIVLMATGNTPIVDASPFNGMRTLSANIAVEIAEAPVGGTLYRLLFLCAVMLFVLTFFLNTVAELVRQRLRKRYGRY